MKSIAVLSSGNDNCGINGAIRSAVRSAIGQGLKIYGVEWGFRGLLEDRIHPITSRSVSGIIGKSGCLLGTTPPKDEMDKSIRQILANLNKRSIEGLVIVGNLDSFQKAQKLIDNGIRVIGIPSDLQDSIPCTEISLGVDSAVNNIMGCIDHIRSCDSSKNRSFLIEVEGSHNGSLALRSAIVSGCEVCLTPENSANDEAGLKKIADIIDKTTKLGKTQCLCIIASGWKPGIKALNQYLSDHYGENDVAIRETILGYVQRGGSPSAFDRILGTEMGNKAVQALIDGETESMVSWNNGKLSLVPFSTVANSKKDLSELLRTFKLTNSY
ncbi:Phosphofructokinase family protein [Histomonas meleagridis]|uniref:Phosphofructokinase family protein n=1 Tax=Histomonas meleagridis TaxID=135588 RepID=UPI00355A9EBA|nr:Phosphofructokinase family protein [Histomonas meleagridis]KAH0801049.1 Phosphofructokinase family protein [Histomonas meleagridis]